MNNTDQRRLMHGRRGEGKAESEGTDGCQTDLADADILNPFL